MALTINKLLWRLTVTALVVAFTVLMLPRPAAAAGISVAPAYLNATISKDQPIQDLAVGIRSNAKAPIQLHVTLGGVDQKAGRIVPSRQIDQGLNSALSISPTEFVLQPEQSINIKLHIQDSASLSPGGHYATLIITQLDSSSQKVGLRSAISVTLFLIKEGGAIRSIAINGISAPHSVFSLPKYVDIDFHSGGNVLVVPRASVTLSVSGSVIAQGAANQQSVPVLPGKTVKLRTEPAKLHRQFWPAHYKLKVVYRYDGSDQTKTYEKTYWYFPPFLILIIVLALAAGYFLKLPGRLRAVKWRKLTIGVWINLRSLKAKYKNLRRQ